jgi:hypothetical protein
VLKQAFENTKDRKADRTLSLKGVLKHATPAFADLKEVDLIRAFAFSKVSIIDEMENAAVHIRMSAVEYYEFL